MPIFSEIITIDRLKYILPVLTLILIAVLVWLAIISAKLRKIKRQNALLFAGKKVDNLEEILLEQAKTLKILDKDIQELYNISNQINSLAAKGIHKTGLIRFNPFKDVGGDQSFAIAFLNGKNNGLTLSSLYTREGTRIFAKNIIDGKTEKYALTEEEKEAIEQATGEKVKK